MSGYQGALNESMQHRLNEIGTLNVVLYEPRRTFGDFCNSMGDMWCRWKAGSFDRLDPEQQPQATQ
jgi:hypothetical protein